ncbi:hypothetical protein CQ13_33505 [Bradyrhizobium retamae]|uniref:Uncharacterized protein n=1 Tax=Bradyrhizobium retamae TaxID=1300035 RepID=A0A0R3MIC6_9BRAD|nr:hypothetical protein CQ13_33505 [Bradyrhizobium retamae]
MAPLRRSSPFPTRLSRQKTRHPEQFKEGDIYIARYVFTRPAIIGEPNWHLALPAILLSRSTSLDTPIAPLIGGLRRCYDRGSLACAEGNIETKFSSRPGTHLPAQSVNQEKLFDAADRDGPVPADSFYGPEFCTEWV